MLEHLKRKEDDFNVDLYNELYNGIKNKVIREYKDELEIVEMQQYEEKAKMPLGWKVYFMSKGMKAIAKLFK